MKRSKYITEMDARERREAGEIARLQRKSGIRLQGPRGPVDPDMEGAGAPKNLSRGNKEELARRIRLGHSVKKSLKEHYKTRLSHRLDEGRFTRALGDAARQTGRAIKAAGRAVHAGGVTATEYTGRGMARLGKYMAAKPKQAFNRGLAATAAAGLVYGGYQLGKHFSGPETKASKPAMRGAPSGRGGGGAPDDTISPVRPGHSRKGPEVAEP